MVSRDRGGRGTRDLNPNLAIAHAEAGNSRLYLGQAEDGFSGVETAMKLSPRDPALPFWEFDICHLHTHLAQWSEAIEHCRRAVQGAPYVWYPYADLVFADAWLGRDGEAKAALTDLLKVKPGLTAKMYTTRPRPSPTTRSSPRKSPAWSKACARLACRSNNRCAGWLSGIARPSVAANEVIE